MAIINAVSGSGSFGENGLGSFSYSEDATPTNPYNINGGSGQISASVDAVTDQFGSRITINNTAQIVDPDYGTLDFTIKQVSQNQTMANIVGDTIQAKMNVTRTAGPQGSDASGYTLYTAILDYCALVDIVPQFEDGLITKIDAIDVDYIGWTGNVWEYLKMLCAATPIDADDNTILEMYILGDTLWFREGLKSNPVLTDYISDESISIESFDAAQQVNIYCYNTDYRAQSVVRQIDAGYGGFAGNELVSITDSISVNANETLIKRVSINASLESVNQPVCVATITAIPYMGTTGEYVIVGNDNIPIQPAQWAAQGGTLTVALTENPNEIEITITGPSNTALEPYKIGVESSGSVDYPALYICGTGVFFDKQQYTIQTGADTSSEVQGVTIDNPFITSMRHLRDRGTSAAQELCGPKYSLRTNLSGGGEFGSLVGGIVDSFDTKFRIENVNFSESSIDVTGRAFVKFSDFNTTWSGMTFDQFNTQMNGISFNEFSIIPLAKGA